MKVELPALHVGQKEVASSKARFKLIVAGRRWGKTFIAAWIALATALKGKNVFWIGPTYQVAERGFEIILRLVRPLPPSFVTISKKNLSITFGNGGKISCKSGEHPDRLRGEGLDLAVFDEAAYVKMATWYEVIRPALADTRGSAIFISTPRGRNWYYVLYKNWLERQEGGDEDYQVYHYASTDNPNIDPKEIEAACAELTEIQCRQEFGGEFVEMTGEVFPAEIFHSYQQKFDASGEQVWVVNGNLVRPSVGQKIMTVDLALTTKSSSDFTAFCTGVVTPQGIGCVTDVHKFKAEAPDLPGAIKNHMRVHQVSIVYVESTAFQLSVVQSLRNQGVTVEALRADKDKVARATYAAIRMDNKQLLWPEAAPWLEEVMASMGSFPDPKVHDDDVDAVSYFAVASTRIAGAPGSMQLMSLDEAYDLDELYGGVNEVVRDHEGLGMKLFQLRGRQY